MNLQNVPTEKLEHQLSELLKMNPDHLNTSLYYAMDNELRARKADRFPISDEQDDIDAAKEIKKQMQDFHTEQDF